MKKRKVQRGSKKGPIMESIGRLNIEEEVSPSAMTVEATSDSPSAVASTSSAIQISRPDPDSMITDAIYIEKNAVETVHDVQDVPIYRHKPSEIVIGRFQFAVGTNRLHGRQLAIRFWRESAVSRFLIEDISFDVTQLTDQEKYGLRTPDFNYPTELAIMREIIEEHCSSGMREFLKLWVSVLPFKSLQALRRDQEKSVMIKNLKELEILLTLKSTFAIDSYKACLDMALSKIHKSFIHGLLLDETTLEFPIPPVAELFKSQKALYMRALILRIVPEISTSPQFIAAVLAIQESQCLKLYEEIEILKTPLEVVKRVVGFWEGKEYLLIKQYGSLFSSKLVNVDFLRDLSKLIRYYQRQYKERNAAIHAPFIAMCQGSGVGKTKSALSLGYSCVLFYINLRQSDDTGFPPASIIRDLVIGLTQPEEFLKFISAILDVFCARIDRYFASAHVLSQEYYNLFQVPEQHFLKVFADLLASPDSSVHSDFWGSVRTLCRQPLDIVGLNNPEQALTERFKRVEQKIAILLGVAEICVVFAFDEARYLLKNGEYAGSAFRAARHTSQMFVYNGFMLFLDTSSRTSNFAFSIKKDDSRRISEECDLLPPIIFIPCVGFLKLDPAAKNYDICTVPSFDGQALVLKYHLFEEIEVGRPMFTAEVNRLVQFVHARNTESSGQAGAAPLRLNSEEKRELEEIIADYEQPRDHIYTHCRLLAEQKVFGGISTHSPAPPSLFHALPCVKYAVGFIGLDTNNTLMSSHMGIATHITHDRKEIKIAYPGEPVVSEAATKLLLQRFPAVIGNLSESIRKGVCIPPGAGDVGELVAPVLVSYAMDTLSLERRKRFSEPIATGFLLQRLLPVNVLTEMKDLEGYSLLMNSFVAFSAFVNVERALDTEMLLRAWDRRVAIYAKRGATGIDFVVPIVIPKTPGTARVIEASMKNISAIVFQVKNTKQALGGDKITAIYQGLAVHESYGTFETPPPLGIAIQVGSHIARAPRQATRNQGYPQVVGGMIVCAVTKEDLMKTASMPDPERAEILKLSQVAPGTRQRIKEQLIPVYPTDIDGLEEMTSLIDSLMRPVQAGPPPHEIVRDIGLISRIN